MHKYIHSNLFTTNKICLTVRLLKSSSCTFTTELLWFHTTWISNQQRSIVVCECVLQSSLAVLVDVLLVVCNQRLSYSLSDSVDLCNLTTSANTDTDVNTIKFVLTYNQNWFFNLHSKDLRFDQVQRGTVDLQQTSACLAISNSSCSFLTTV